MKRSGTHRPLLTRLAAFLPAVCLLWAGASSLQAMTLRLGMNTPGTYVSADCLDTGVFIEQISPAGTAVPVVSTALANPLETWQLTATCLSTYQFDQWTVSPAGGVLFANAFDPNTTMELQNGFAAVTVRATFKVIPPVQRTLTVSSDGNHANISPSLGPHLYDTGTTVYLSATPNPGYVFARWADPAVPGVPHPRVAIDNSTGVTRYSILMDRDDAVRAEFGIVYTITHNVYDPTTPLLTYVQTAAAGTKPTVTVPATPVTVSATERYTCIGWTGGGPQIPATGGTTSYTFLNPINANNALTWTWQHEYAVDGVVAGGIGDIVAILDSYNNPANYRNWVVAGSSLPLSAAPGVGYVFVQWTSIPAAGIIPVGQQSNPNITINPVNQPFTIIAEFRLMGNDSDNDGLPDAWENRNGLNPYDATGDNGPAGDPDNDGLSNFREYTVSYSNNVSGLFLEANPLDADTDGDYMNDGWEYRVFQFDAPPATAAGTPPPGLLDDGSFAPNNRYGQIGNPDGDYRWDTSTGWQMGSAPLYNIQEYYGPDGEEPVTYEIVPIGGAASDGWINTTRGTVRRAIANPNETYDSSHPLEIDADNDSLDDGFEYSWDIWHQLNGGAALANTTYWPAITDVVTAWSSAGGGYRPFNPAVPALAVLGAATWRNLDQDYWYQTVPQAAGGSGGATFDLTDSDEYNASALFTTNATGSAYFYPVTRQYVPATGLRWCTNPFVWDSDYDGMPDGWELCFGYDPWYRGTLMANGYYPHAGANPDIDYFAYQNPTTKHRDVYTALGFNPTTAIRVNGQPGATTAAYINIEELRGTTYPPACTLANQLTWGSTHPLTEDGDTDVIYDGWELYAGLDPTTAADAGQDPDNFSLYVFTQHPVPGDGLPSLGEFLSFNTPPGGYTNASGYRVPGWYNKILPTDPFDWDTDSDQLNDDDERLAFNTGAAAVLNGGLTPTTVDTDDDYMPDAWEATYGTTASNYPAIIVAGQTCNGTVADYLDDPDGDGLLNYQEYMISCVYHWQFQYNNGGAAWVAGLGLHNYEPYDFFDPALSGGEFWFGPGGRAPRPWDPNFLVIGPPIRPPVPFTFVTANEMPTGIWFSSTDPLGCDTDGDMMDDYWEVYHGLDPLYGDLDIVRTKVRGAPQSGIGWRFFDQYDLPAGWPPDFRTRPWLAGNQLSDSDQDQLSDIDESLQVQSVTNRAPPNYHTDPSPIWMTDISSPDSFVNLYYWTGRYFGGLFLPYPYWWWDPLVILLVDLPPTYVYDVEMNEGFDTDNDFLADRAELVSTPQSAGVTDPLNSLTPPKRRAMYFDGDSAARTMPQYQHDPFLLSRFTAECWARSETPATGIDQIILERPAAVAQGHHQLPAAALVVNFRIGLDPTGRPYVAYNGSQTPFLFVEAKAPAQSALQANRWYHLAATYDGDYRADGQWTGILTLYVDGEEVAVTPSSEIPMSGWILGDNSSTNFPPGVGLVYPMPIVVAAGDNNPWGWVDGHTILNGPAEGLDKSTSPPVLHNYFKGWVDQVRIWDNGRSKASVQFERYRRYTRTEVASLAVPGTLGGPGLVYCYAMDDTPDPDTFPGTAMLPQGYEVLGGRPPTYINQPWWAMAADRGQWYSELYVPWIENLVAHLPMATPRDVGSPNSPTVASTDWYPNTANPYGLSYRTSTRFSVPTGEFHPFLFDPAGLSSVINDPRNLAHYPDLLPLRWAAADEAVEMWDGGGDGTKPYDSDGDHLPDDWEILYGLDYLDPTGDYGEFGDPDGDGLNNYAEYLVGTNPWTVDTDFDGIPDFEDRPNDDPAARRFCEIANADTDFMEDDWEVGIGNAYYISPVLYDPHVDRDADGWDNWSECRADPEGWSQSTRPDTISGEAYQTTPMPQYPRPLVNIDLHYKGLRDLGGLVMLAYSTPEMDGEPDATFTVALGVLGTATVIPQGLFSAQGTPSIVGYLTPGHLQRGAATFFYPVLGGGVVVFAQDDALGNIITPFGTVGSIDYTTGGYEFYRASLPYVNGTAIYATYNYFVSRSDWPIRVSVRHASQGHLRQGKNYFFAFLDNNGDGLYTTGEPAGLAEGYVNDIGWDTLDLEFGLTDEARSYARFNWTVPAGDDSAHTVSIIRYGTGTTVFQRTMRAPRTWVHEGDIIYYNAQQGVGGNGLDWGAASQIMVYQWKLDGVTMGTFTNQYSAALAAPVPIEPKGADLRYARPEFRWTMAPEATEFEFDLRTNAVAGVSLFSGRFLAPFRRPGDLCVWDFPYTVGDRMPNGNYLANSNSYLWRVRAYSPKATVPSAWSSNEWFRLRVGATPETSLMTGWMDINVRYYGRVTNSLANKVRVQAFRTRSFNDEPAAEITINSTGVVTLAGLNPGDYYVRAFIDQDGDYERDTWESWGYVRTDTNRVWAFNVRPVPASDRPGRKPYDLFMEDANTDQDALADGWEYMYFGASADWLAVAGPGTTYSSPPYSDYDGDHLNDYAEYWLGSDPTSSDSDGDGLGDRVDRDLGFSPIRANKLLVTQVARTGTGDTTLQWQWVSLPAGTSGQPTELGLLVDYVVERCTSLERPAWMQVSEVLTRMASGEAEVAASAASSDTKWCNGGASGKGGEGTGAAEPEFYRVRAVIDESYLSE